MPKIPPEAIFSFCGSLGEPPPPHLAAQRAARFRDSESSAALAQRILADIEVLVRRANRVHHRRAVPEPPAPHPPDYKFHLLVDASISPVPDNLDTAHVRFAIWFRRQLAALRLAEIGTEVAHRLELLAAQQPQLVKSVAQRCTDWPVNLHLGKADIKGKRKLLRSEAAKNYLSAIDLNAFSHVPHDVSAFAVKPSKPKTFSLAAEQIVEHLRILRNIAHDWLPLHASIAGDRRIAIAEGPEWVTRLMALQEPITESNVPDWWAVAKEFLDEVLLLNPVAFKPLFDRRRKWAYPDGIESRYTPSKLQSRVINDDLRKAFFSLAIHAVSPVDSKGTAA